MNKHGFTLIELTAIIAVLAVIFLVSFPIILNITKTDKDNQDKMIEQNLCLLGRQYIYSNLDNFEEISTIESQFEVSISDLIEYGNTKIENQRYNDLLIYTVLEDYSLDCEYLKKE